MSVFKGVKSYLLEQGKQFKYVTSILESVAHSYSYDPCYISLIDSKSLYHNTLGDTSDIVTKEMFELKYKDFVLRPEGTANLMQYILKDNLHVKKPLPFKMYYTGPMFRHERPQKGRYRQFWQHGVEYINNYEHPVQDVDIISMCEDIMKKCNIENDVELNINTIGSSVDRMEYSKYIINYFNDNPKLKAELSVDSQQRLQKNAIRILDSKDLRDQEIICELKNLNDFINPYSKHYFEEIINLLQSKNIRFNVNSKLVRGLDYYNDFCFEYLIKEQGVKSQNAVLAGGRYNILPNKISGNDKHKLFSIGFAFGIDRLLDNLGHKMLNITEDKLVLGIAIILENDSVTNKDIYSYISKIEATLKDICLLDIYYIADHDFKKAFRYYEDKDIKNCVLIGENEVKNNCVEMRNLVTKSQRSVNINELFDCISANKMDN